MMREKEKTEEMEIEETDERSTREKRKLVVPGETIVSGDDFLPGDFTRKEGEDIIANRYGLAEISGNSDIGGPYGAFLPLAECPRFINRNDIAEFANIGDVINAKIWSVKRGSVDLTLKSRGLGVLEGGRIIRINPHKVPRIIGKEGSMINLIKDSTKTEITVGQNGFIWLKGELEGEKKAEDAINLIVKESASDGLTEKIERFLEK